jgi:hypothetical protein
MRLSVGLPRGFYLSPRFALFVGKVSDTTWGHNDEVDRSNSRTRTNGENRRPRAAGIQCPPPSSQRGREFNIYPLHRSRAAGIQFVTSGPKGRESRIGARASHQCSIFLFNRSTPSGLRRFAPEFTYWIPAFAGMTGQGRGNDEGA